MLLYVRVAHQPRHCFPRTGPRFRTANKMQALCSNVQPSSYVDSKLPVFFPVSCAHMSRLHEISYRLAGSYLTPCILLVFFLQVARHLFRFVKQRFRPNCQWFLRFCFLYPVKRTAYNYSLTWDGVYILWNSHSQEPPPQPHPPLLLRCTRTQTAPPSTQWRFGCVRRVLWSRDCG